MRPKLTHGANHLQTIFFSDISNNSGILSPITVFHHGDLGGI